MQLIRHTFLSLFLVKMRLCDNPYSVPVIDIDECIGLSLATINANVNNIKEELCLNDDELATIQTNVNILSSNIVSLSSITPGFASAWVVFDGTRDTNEIYTLSGDRLIYKSSGVASVSRVSTGTYTITYTQPFSNTNYALIGTSSETLSGGRYTWLQPITFGTTSATINIHSDTDNVATLADAEYISISIYNN